MLGSWDKNGGAGVDAASPLAEMVSGNGLADSFMAFNTNYADTGLFGVYAVAPKGSDHEDLCWSIMRQVTKLNYSVNPADVARAKNQLKASILFSQDGTTGEGAEGEEGAESAEGESLLAGGEHRK